MEVEPLRSPSSAISRRVAGRGGPVVARSDGCGLKDHWSQHHEQATASRKVRPVRAATGFAPATGQFEPEQGRQVSLGVITPGD